LSGILTAVEVEDCKLKHYLSCAAIAGKHQSQTTTEDYVYEKIDVPANRKKKNICILT
jgi:hypothetical protein